MSCASEPRGRALDALADPARAKDAIRRIADELGVHPEALRTWVKKAQVDQGTRPGTTTDEAQRIKELEKEVRELRRANAILNSASACLSRRSVSAHPVDLPVHRDQEGGVRGLAGLQGAHWRRSQDRPEHLTHAAKTRSPSARSLRDEPLKTETRRVHENQLPRCWGPARCTRCGADPRPPSVTVPVTWPAVPPVRLMGDLGLRGVRRARSPRTTRSAPREQCPADLARRHFEAFALGGLWVADIPPLRGRYPLLCTRLLRVGLCGFRDRRVLPEDHRLAEPPTGQCAPTWPWTPFKWPSGSGNEPVLT